MLESERFRSYLQAEKRVSPHTLSAYLTDHGQFAEFLTDTYEINQVDLVSHDMLRSWVVSLLDSGLQPRSIQRKVSAMRTFFRVLLRDGIISSDPTRQVSTPKRGSRVPEFIEEGDMLSLLDEEHFTPDFPGQRDRLILTLLYQTGMRRAELISLTEASLNRSKSELLVLGKRNKERIIPIAPVLLKQIEAYLSLKEKHFNGQAAPEIIVTSKGKKPYPKFVYERVNRYLFGATSVRQKSPHILRHTFATHMLNHGADLNVIKEILGHASLAATQVYTHNSIEQLKSIHKQAHPKG